MPTVEVQQLTRFLNLSERRIGQLVKEGMPKKGVGNMTQSSAPAGTFDICRRRLKNEPRRH